MDELTSLREWVKSGQGNRSIEIKIGETNDSTHFNIWAYDYELQEGQFVESTDQINLKKKKENAEKALYEKLKVKFEGAI